MIVVEEQRPINHSLKESQRDADALRNKLVDSNYGGQDFKMD